LIDFDADTIVDVLLPPSPPLIPSSQEFFYAAAAAQRRRYLKQPSNAPPKMPEPCRPIFQLHRHVTIFDYCVLIQSKK
jgi:hypothetical protein